MINVRYLNALDVLETHYRLPLLTAVDAKHAKLLATTEVDVIFGGLIGMADVSRDFVERL
jgi:hypothetical protein